MFRWCRRVYNTEQNEDHKLGRESVHRRRNTVLLNVNGLCHQSIFFLNYLLQYSKLPFRFASQFANPNITSEKLSIS